MGDRSLRRRFAPSVGLLAFGAGEATVGLLTVRGTDRRAAGGVRGGGASSTAPFRRGAARLGFATVAFGLVIAYRHSKNLGHYINLPRGAQGSQARRDAHFARPRPPHLTASPIG